MRFAVVSSLFEKLYRHIGNDIRAITFDGHLAIGSDPYRIVVKPLPG